MQNRRVIVTTAARVAAIPFRKVRFDVLIAEEAPRIPSPFLLAAAGWCANALCSPAICGSDPHSAWNLQNGLSTV